MAKLIERLKVLEANKINVHEMPFITVVDENGETDRQLLDIAEAEKSGRNLVTIVKEEIANELPNLKQN